VSEPKALYNIAGTSKVLPWPLQWPPKDRFADGKNPGMPFIGDVVSEWLVCTRMEAILRRAELARQHRSSDFTFTAYPA
jgi:hypothetical protein